MSIVFIAPSEGMARTARRIAAGFPDGFEVAVGLLTDAVPLARRFEKAGAEAFISRGGTILALRESGIVTPIVEMQITGRDLALALAKARNLVSLDRSRVGVVSFPNMTSQLREFIPFLSFDLRCYELSTEANVESVIDEAAADGSDVILGGIVTVDAAKRRGMPAVLIESGKTAFRFAFEEARRIVQARRLESRKAEELKAILEYADEGIVAVNASGEITLLNPAARAMLEPVADVGMGRAPVGFPGEVDLGVTLTSGEEDTGRIVHLGRARAVVNRVPIRVGGEVAGAVATLRDVTRIQEMEELVRRDKHEKGHLARFRFEDILARDPAMRRTLDLARRYARTRATVVIHGETGVGKELLAQSIHNASDRASFPFVAVNCAALPESLLESELFGYVDGAFTGASKRGKPGLFELAHRGTLFLDEVSEIPLGLQGRLLRALQEREVVRLGHDRVTPVDVRVISATNRNLRDLAERGDFRSDLYWRLEVLCLSVPPLRSRKADILPLLRKFLCDADACRGSGNPFSPECEEFLEAYFWPGNIRELRNFCERVAAVCDGESLDRARARELLGTVSAGDGDLRNSAQPRTASPVVGRRLDDDRLLEAVRESSGMEEAARRLGIHRSTLWRRLKRLGAV